MRYDLPDRRMPSRLRLLFPTLILLVVLTGLFFGTVYVLATSINIIASLIEGIL